MWALAALVGSYLGAIIGGFGMAVLRGYIDAPLSALIAIGALSGGFLVGGGALYIGLVRKCGWGWSELGFTRPEHSLWHLTWWVPLTVIIGGVCASLIGSFLNLEPSGGNSVSDGSRMGATAGVLMVLLAVVIFPFIEEVVYRRVLFDWASTVMPTYLAATLITVLFALAHLAPPVMAYILFVGISLILARLWFKSLWAPLVIHAANNALVTVVSLTVLNS